MIKTNRTNQDAADSKEVLNNHHAQKHDHKHAGHHHHHEVSLQGSKLLWVTFLNLSITLVQIVGGLISNSLSLLSDAIHNLGDSSALFIAFLAGKRSRKAADVQHTFGYKRIEILAALFNAVVLIVICIFLFYEAYKRFQNPEPIRGLMMFVVAIFGLLANLISVIILNKDKAKNLNMKAAYLHLMGDTLSSVAVILGALAIWIFKIYWIDPLITVLVGLYIIWHTWSVVVETIDILMQRTPETIDLYEIQRAVEALDEVDNLHHIHVWKLNDSEIHLEAHVSLKENMMMSKNMLVKKKIEDLLHEKFKVQHITLQMEYDSAEIGGCHGKEAGLIVDSNSNSHS